MRRFSKPCNRDLFDLLLRSPDLVIIQLGQVLGVEGKSFPSTQCWHLVKSLCEAGAWSPFDGGDEPVGYSEIVLDVCRFFGIKVADADYLEGEKALLQRFFSPLVFRLDRHAKHELIGVLGLEYETAELLKTYGSAGNVMRRLPYLVAPNFWGALGLLCEPARRKTVPAILIVGLARSMGEG